MNARLPELLAQRLAQPLPGPMVGSRFESRSPRGWRYDRPLADARPAAVLLLLYPHEGRWHVPLTLRPAHLPAHAGQVSLPGGAVDPDETGAEAAIREFHEELGAEGCTIRLLGRLSPIYTGTSNFLIEPWIGVSESRPAMTPNPEEVETLLEVPLEHLLDAANFGSHERSHQGQIYVAPHFLFGQCQIWGATCMILGEFVTILEEALFRESVDEGLRQLDAGEGIDHEEAKRRILRKRGQDERRD